MANEGRQPDGRFGPGNPGGPGRADGSGTAQRWANALRDATTIEDFKAVWAAITAAAKGGDIKAAEVFLSRLMGKPAQSVEITGSEGGPMQITWTFGEGKANDKPLGG